MTLAFLFYFYKPLAIRWGICYNYGVYSKYRGDENYLRQKPFAESREDGNRQRRMKYPLSERCRFVPFIARKAAAELRQFGWHHGVLSSHEYGMKGFFIE